MSPCFVLEEGGQTPHEWDELGEEVRNGGQMETGANIRRVNRWRRMHCKHGTRKKHRKVFQDINFTKLKHKYWSMF